MAKWACRKNTKKKLIVIGGNGTRHVMVIIGNGEGLDLEDLAGGETPRLRREPDGSKFLSRSSKFLIFQVVCAILAAVWIVFLITVVGLKQNVWYLLGVGGLGMIQNVVAAGARRRMGTKGIHLDKVDTIENKKVMQALKDCEVKYNGVGCCLLKEFFPGELRDDEKSWWDGKRTTYENAKKTKSEKEKKDLEKENERGVHQLDSNPKGAEAGDTPTASTSNDQRV